MAADSTFSIVVLPEPVPPEMRMFSLPRTQASRNCAAFGVSVPNLIRSSIVSGSLRNFRIVSVGPVSASGGMIALTREPSGRRASTIGEASSMRRPMRRDDLVDDPQQVLRRRRSRRSVRVELAVALDVDRVRAVDHDLADGVVAQERLERPVAEDVVGDLAGDLRALLRA